MLVCLFASLPACHKTCWLPSCHKTCWLQTRHKTSLLWQAMQHMANQHVTRHAGGGGCGFRWWRRWHGFRCLQSRPLPWHARSTRPVSMPGPPPKPSLAVLKMPFVWFWKVLITRFSLLSSIPVPICARSSVCHESPFIDGLGKASVSECSTTTGTCGFRKVGVATKCCEGPEA